MKYIYDGLNIIAEMDVNNNITKTYTHNLAIDDPLAITTNGQTYYYHKDGLGTITSLTDSTGTIVQKYEYDSFGNLTLVQNPAFKQPYTYTGREWDEETGLYYYRARYYDSKAGKFLTLDPISFVSGDTNLYRYVFNSPMNYTDPLGLAGPAAPVVVAEAAKDVVIIGGLTAAYLYFVSPDGKATLSHAYKTAEDLMKDIEEWEKKRDEELKKCKTSLGQPEFPGPKQEPPKDFKMKVALVISQLLKLLNQIEKLILKH